MLYIIAIMALGILAGFMLRRRQFKYLDTVMMVVVWLLLFLLGVEAGSDERVVRWIASLGGEAVVISLGGVIGSSVCALLLWRVSGYKKVEERRGGHEG